MKTEDIEIIADKIKNAIENEFTCHNYDMALSLISVCASIYYHTNIKYTDQYLETRISSIADNLNLVKTEPFKADDDVVLFWDGFGLNNRGLARIYLKALCKIKTVIYVTYEDRKDSIPDLEKIISEGGGINRFIKRKKTSYTKMIESLNAIVSDMRPGHLFFYSVPDDVVATSIMYAYEGRLIRYQVNLTDHAFWLG